ncbi:hypothetical protein NE235_03560 [Actinoallomurus spadix]|uniref:Uncharacterized protein n=1 Tax=Actinoallomurus spadix TaxID=79912 RepID=A0ABP3HG05_9ACTN|nr:hypothetical protein [Actinoallomurus spadix]MCO5985181.1 hypothetical protein [Actinoallomurus spadix]
MRRRSPTLIRLARRTRTPRGVVTFTESTGQVCDAACRSDARLDRARTTAIATSFGYRI